MGFLGVLHIAGMSRSDILEEFTDQLRVYWVTEYCNRSLPRLLAMVGDHELHSKEYYGNVFRGIYKKLKINNCAGLV